MDKTEDNSIDLSVESYNLKSLRDVVVEKIREAIVEGFFKPGQRLKERELAEMMQVSTTPIKEALRILNSEGLVETLPRRGTFVSKMANSSVEEVLVVKAYLEGLGARMAASKMTPEELKQLEMTLENMTSLMEENKVQELEVQNALFHSKIVDAARNPVIQQILTNIISFDTAFRKRALKNNVEVVESFLEHQAIFEAIRQRDPDQAEDRMKHHVLRSARVVLTRD
jgi:DNA-binding GntR family transcriptional regulator